MTDSAYHKMQTEIMPAPVGCPVNREFSTFEEHYMQDPYAELHRLRHESPIFYSEKLGYLVLTRMEDVSEVFRNADVFSSENVQDPVLPICDAAAKVLAVPDYNPIAVMSNRARPDHTRIRKYTMAGFSKRRMQVLADLIRRRCEMMVEEMLAGGSPAEFVRHIGHPLPGETIFRLIGFPEKDDRKLKGWTTNRLAFTWGKTTEAEQVNIAEKMLIYWRYCVSFVAYRLEHPEDDFTSELLAAHKDDPEELTYKEIESVVYGLSFAGHEIVSNMLSNGLISLLRHRDYWEEICTDPILIPNAVEEILRFNSPQTSWRRVTTDDTEIANYKIPKGTQVFLSLGSANHDETVFDDPESFDIHRKNARQNIAFGRGIHFCLGKRLAILEAEIALETLTKRVPSRDILQGQKFEFFPNFTFRGPAELWLTWDT